MNKTLWLILLLLLVAVATGFLLWRGGGTGDSLPDRPVATPGDDSRPAEPMSANAVGAGGDEVTGSEPAALQRIALEDGTGNIHPLMVQVVEGTTGVPAPEIDVFFLDGFEGPELTDPFAQHWSDLAEDRGLRFKTDAQGLVELPGIQDWAIVTAQRPNAYGFSKVGSEHKEVETIILRPDQTVTVRVVDGEVRPVASVPVGIVQHVPLRQEMARWTEQLKVLQQQMAEVERHMRDNPQQRQDVAPKLRGLRQQVARLTGALRDAKAGDEKTGRLPAAPLGRNQPPATTGTELRAQRLTDEEGAAVFRHFQLYRHEREAWWPAEQVDRFEAALLMPLQRPESLAFGNPVPTQALELHMPPTGSLALRAIDLDGRPFTQPMQAVLRMLEVETVPWARVQARNAGNEGLMVFPYVGLGLRLMARCGLEQGGPEKGRPDEESFRWDSPPFDGPLAAGEQVTVDLIVAPDAGMLFGRLLDAFGEPLSGASPTFSLESHAGQIEGQELTLDSEGRFHLPYLLRNHQAPFRLEIREDDAYPTAGLALTLAALPSRRVTDLGDLRLDALGSVAHGTVVDDRGEAIPGATLQLQRERETSGDRRGMAFVDEAFVAIRTDAEGSYQLFGGLEPGRYRLRAEAKDHFPLETPDLRPGQQMDLELLRVSRVVGTVVTPEWMPAANVRAHLESASEPGHEREEQVRESKGSGETLVYFDQVPPGIYNLSLSVLDFPDPILRVDGLEILPGQQGLHPRLQDLDLGAFVYHFEVDAFDEHGQPFKPSAPVLLARITRMDGRAGFVGIPWGTGGTRAEIISASPQLEVIPFSVGYRAERTVLSPGYSQLQYLRIPPVQLVMPGLRALVGTTAVSLTVTLVGETELPESLETWDPRSGRIANWYRGSRSTVAELGQGDSVELSVMMDGRYKVTAHLGDKSRGVRPVPVELGEVEVRLEPGGPPERVTVPYDPEQVQAGLALLGGG